MAQTMSEYQEENEQFGRHPTREELGSFLRSGLLFPTGPRPQSAGDDPAPKPAADDAGQE